MNVTEAIRQLRPQFAERERLRKTFQQLCKTYINTIPQDVVDIIFGMIPLLQVGPEIMQHDLDKFNEFCAKYQIIEDGVRKFKYCESPYMDRHKLAQDFPEYALMFLDNRASMKWIGDKLYVTEKPDQILYAGHEYFVRNDYLHRSTMGIKLETPPKIKIMKYASNHVRRVLPCGLAIGTLPIGNQDQYLMDLENDKYILLDLPYNWSGNQDGVYMMDDYGIIHKYPNTESVIAGEFGTQFGMFASILLE